jgi:succinoglycan biosynthesis transport protein ExoP
VEAAGYFSVARRWWWTLLVATGAAALAGFLLASQIAPTYVARVELLVGPYNTDTDTLGASGRLVQTYAELVTTEPLLASAIAEAGADVSVSALAARTRANANDTTRFLTIDVQDTNPERARDLANALADEISQLASLDTSRPEGQIQVVDAARTPTEPTGPQVPLLVGVAALAALLGALVLMLLIEYFSPKVRTQEDLERVSDVPFLGRLDTVRKTPYGLDQIERLLGSAAAGGYRMVAAKVAFGEDGDAVRSILIVGTAADGVRGQVAANLAAVVADGGRRVVLIDADPTDAQVTRIFDLQDHPGLADLAEGSVREVTTSLKRISGALRVMPRGTAAGADDIDAATVSAILEMLGESTDLVVVSTGPLHLSASALIWARACDSTMVVGVRDVSRREDVTYGVENLRLVGVQPRGAILAVRRRSFGRRQVGAQPSGRVAEPVLDMASPVSAVAEAPAPPSPDPSVASGPSAPPAAAVSPRRSPRPKPSTRATRGRSPRATRDRGSAGETGP